MSLRTFYKQFVEALGDNFLHPIDITWNYGSYLVSSSPLDYSGAVGMKSLNEEELRRYLMQKEVTQKVIDKVVELLPQKGGITLYKKSYIGELPPPQYYCLIVDCVILYSISQ